MKKIARVFPSKTKATPDDELCFFDTPPMNPPEVDEVHISVAFKWDIPRAEWLSINWEHVAPVKIGGPAYGAKYKLGDFTPGMYIKTGYVFTSRGCPNQYNPNNDCWFCSEPPGPPFELEIKDGWNVLDPNILATSQSHFQKVIEMLKGQKKIIKEQKIKNRKIEFTGGLEAKRLKFWHVDLLADLKPGQIFFAYDTPVDYDPLVEAGRKLIKAGFKPSNHQLRCYCLVGYEGDTFEKAEKRLMNIVNAGFVPMAMLYRSEKTGEFREDWKPFQREWVRKRIICSKPQVKEILSKLSN